MSADTILEIQIIPVHFKLTDDCLQKLLNMEQLLNCKLLLCSSSVQDAQILQQNIATESNHQRQQKRQEMKSSLMSESGQQKNIFSFKLQQFRNIELTSKQTHLIINSPQNHMPLLKRENNANSPQQQIIMFSPVHRPQMSPNIKFCHSPPPRTVLIQKNYCPKTETKVCFTKKPAVQIINTPKIRFQKQSQSTQRNCMLKRMKTLEEQTQYSSKHSQIHFKNVNDAVFEKSNEQEIKKAAHKITMSQLRDPRINHQLEIQQIWNESKISEIPQNTIIVEEGGQTARTLIDCFKQEGYNQTKNKSQMSEDSHYQSYKKINFGESITSRPFQTFDRHENNCAIRSYNRDCIYFDKKRNKPNVWQKTRQLI